MNNRKLTATGIQYVVFVLVGLGVYWLGLIIGWWSW